MRPINKPLLFWLVIVTAMIVVFGFWQIRYHISSPFAVPEIAGQIVEQDVISAYKNLDTDQDGLFDYQETRVHGTSAFLADSDGDGFIDKEEIETESSPLDPVSTPLNKLVSREKSILIQEVMPSLDAGSITSPSTRIITDQEDVSVQKIRDLLVNQGGLSRELVDGLLDEDLIRLYNETKEKTGFDLSELTKPGSVQSNFSEAVKVIQETDINLLREMLINKGMDRTMLEKINDQELRDFFLQILSQTE